MLLNLHIKNMALIDEIDIDFKNHLNILTGETGAGKSIVIDSIMIALGNKVPKDFVRKDAEYGLVELVFLIEDEELLHRLQDLEVLDIEQGELILSRKIMDNRSVCKVNGETMTITKMREIAKILLDLHAQHEHQSLLDPAKHMQLLDRYGHKEIDPLKQKVENLFEEYQTIKTEISKNSMNEEEKKRQLDLILFEKNEIEKASLKIGEDEQLEERYKLAMNSKNIADGLVAASHYVNDIASDAIDRATRELLAVAQYDSSLSSMADSLTTVADVLSDFSRDARLYLDENVYSQEEFVQIEERLNLLNHLKAKYGKTTEDVLKYYDELEESYDRLTNHELYLNELKNKLAVIEGKLEEACIALSKKRKTVANVLVEKIKDALLDLNFLDVRFDMLFERTKDYRSDGYDASYFIISTNVGEEMKPLWQVVSGGELSRIMLAIKSCLADVDSIETLIFDEIDVGISGRTAQMVAQKIHTIAKSHQVICITHLPQIAAMANHHYLIEKKVVDEKTITNISYLSKEDEIKELARLIGGVEITDTVMQSAKEMKELAGKAKVD